MNAPDENSIFLPASQQEAEAQPGFSTRLLCFLLLGVGSAISVGTFIALRNDALSDELVKFERQASDAHHNIEARVRSYTDIVYGLRALMYASPQITRSQFHNYIVGLDLPRRFPGVMNLNYAEHVAAGEKGQFENKVRRDTSLDSRGYPNFAIRPPGERAYYHVLTYLEPMAGVELSFGRDIIAQPEIREIFERQIFASDELSSSGRPPLIAGPPPFWSIAMRLPVYRRNLPLDTLQRRKAALAGTLGTGFRVQELLQNVLDKSTLETLRFQVYEAGPAASATAEKRLLLFDSLDPQAAPGAVTPPLGDDVDFRTVLPLTVAGRLWEIQYSVPTGAMISRNATAMPWLVLFGGLLISLLLFGTAYSLASARSRAVALANEITYDLQKSEAELRTYAERLKAVSRRLFEVQESERRLLARELHDRVGQSLTALGLNVSIIAARMSPETQTELAPQIADSTALIEQTMDSMRNVMSELRPQAIDEYGLLAPLRAFASGFSGRSGIEVAVDGQNSASEPRLPRTVELAMFRIVQEALNNIAKHAKAHHVDITLTNGNGGATLVVQDDGVGFDARRIDVSRPDAHWGLLIMRERAEAAGARFSIESSPGSGTRICVEYRN